VERSDWFLGGHNLPAVNSLWFIYLLCYWLFYVPWATLTKALSAIGDTHDVYRLTHVPTFYAPRVEDPWLLFTILLPIAAVIFGGLHCIGWNFHFPTHVEQLLWRIGSLAITLLPSVPPIIMGIVWLVSRCIRSAERSGGNGGGGGRMDTAIDVMVIFLIGLLLIPYISARILLLTQAIVLLRKQPESAFYAIVWSKFLPHV